jgi:hypothetical protein
MNKIGADLLPVVHLRLSQLDMLPLSPMEKVEMKMKILICQQLVCIQLFRKEYETALNLSTYR